MDLVKLETARQIFATLTNYDAPSFVKDVEFRRGLMAACADAADHLCMLIGEAKGHPAETALEQLFDLFEDHPDKAAFKWIKANAKVRGLTELCAYLGAERVADPLAH